MTIPATDRVLQAFDDALLAERVASLLDLDTTLAYLVKGTDNAIGSVPGAPVIESPHVRLESATRRFRRKMLEAGRAYQSALLSEMKWDVIDEVFGTEGTKELFGIIEHPNLEGVRDFGMHLVKDEIANAVGGPVAETLVELWSDGFFSSFHDGASWSLNVLTNGQADEFLLRDPNILHAINDRIAFRAAQFGDELGDAITDWLRHGMFDEGQNPLDMKRRLRRDWPQFAGWRFDRIARTESLIGVESGAFETFKRNGVQFIEWQSHIDHRTRRSHRLMDGYEVKIGDKFPNGLRYPGDPDGRIGEIINCRCVLAPVNPDLVSPDRLWTGGEDPKMFAAPHGDREDAFYEYTFKNGGDTFDPRTGHHANTGFAVAAHDGTFAQVDVGDREGFKDAIRRLREQYPDAQVGTWVHDGKIDIDPSMVIHSREEAVKAAIQRNQIALFDLGSKNEINLSRVWGRLSDAEKEALLKDNRAWDKWYRQNQYISADEGISPADLKAKVVKDLASRVNGKPGFNNETTFSQAVNGEIVDYTEAKQKANTMLEDWTRTTYHDPPASGTQRAADLEFEVGSSRPYGSDGSKASTAADRALNMRLFNGGNLNISDRRTLLRAEYTATQEALDQQGVSQYVTMYRGMTLPKGKQPGSMLNMKPGDITTMQIAQNPLSSWTTSPDIAEAFGSPGMTSKFSDNDGFVLKAVVPRDRIVSTAVTGNGAAHEYEATVLDTPGEVEVLKTWDGSDMSLNQSYLTAERDPQVTNFWKQR